jgi:hypothetical protein
VAPGERPVTAVAGPPGTCGFPPTVPGCTPLRVATVAGSGYYQEDTRFAYAADGNTCTYWNSGAFAPQDLDLQLAAPEDVDKLLLVPAMLPESGRVQLEVSTSRDHQTWTTVRRGSVDLRSTVPYILSLSPSPPAQWIRVRTLASPSWVAWSEVVPQRCR